MIFIAAAFLTLAIAIPTARSAIHNVTVGGSTLAYTPNFVNADVGDTILFTFLQKNHTATQSSFADPCGHLEGGFDTGFQPVAANNTDGPFPIAQLTVTNTDPIWVYCRQTGHCGQGMVFAVNPGNDFAAFQQAAIATASNATKSLSSISTSTTSAAAQSPSVVTVTATVTVNGQDFTTTYASYPGSAQPTTISSSNHLVTVGADDELAYNPSNITAQPGDTITFQFMAKNHTATQSSFGDPCRKLQFTSTSGQIGFDSGFMPVAANASSFPEFTIQVNNTSPIWVYCKQTNPVPHCGSGMVFSANAIESGPNNFSAFQALAKELNGTNSTSSSNSSSTSNGAMSVNGPSHGAGAMVGFVTIAIAFGVLF